MQDPLGCQRLCLTLLLLLMMMMILNELVHLKPLVMGRRRRRLLEGLQRETLPMDLHLQVRKQMHMEGWSHHQAWPVPAKPTKGEEQHEQRLQNVILPTRIVLIFGQGVQECRALVR